MAIKTLMDKLTAGAVLCRYNAARAQPQHSKRLQEAAEYLDSLVENYEEHGCGVELADEFNRAYAKSLELDQQIFETVIGVCKDGNIIGNGSAADLIRYLLRKPLIQAA